MTRNQVMILLAVIHSIIFPQPFIRVSDGVNFIDSTGVMRNPFSGGHNNIKMQFVDIDADGDKDMIFLDGDGTSGWFENTGSAQNMNLTLRLTPLPGFEVRNWFWLTDIDGDGDHDLFTGNTDNLVRFFRNTGSAVSARFTLVTDTLRTTDGEPIISESSCNPAFADVDADGDFDLISGNSVGTLSFYKNTGTGQNPAFEFVTDTWMNIIIIGGGFTTRHGASAIEFGDIDGDGDLDMFWGDFFGKSVYYIENTGNAQNPAYFVKHSTYPQNADSILTSGFNMPRLSDIDADGDLDLFISVLYDPTVPQVLMYYENAGTITSPDYRLKNSDLLHTLDAGIQSYPSFVDINGDGKKDFFLSNAQNPDGSIFYFKNTSSQNQLSYLLEDRTFMNITGELSLSAEFGDINGDGLPDLLVGNFNGTLSLFLNSGTAQNPVYVEGIQLTDSAGQTIDVGIYAKPRLGDIDADGDLDLIIGAFNGRSRIYRNTGTAVSWVFSNAEAEFVIPDVGDNSSPLFYDYNRDGRPDLFIGNKSGYIWYLENSGTVTSPQWTLVTDDFLGQSLGIDAVPCFFDLDGDGDDDLFIGNYRGGICYFRNDMLVSVSETNPIELSYDLIHNYPNPFNSSTTISFNLAHSGDAELRIFDILGNLVLSKEFGFLTSGKHHKMIDLPADYASGTYYYRLTLPYTSYSGKMIYLK